MKRQYIRLFSFLIGLTFLASGILFSFVNNYKKDKKEKIAKEEIIADEIKDIYEAFYNKEKELSIFREEFLQDMNEFSEYFAIMPEKYEELTKEIKKYETLISEIEDGAYFLKQKCTKRYYVLVANDKCDAYYVNLEKTINYFLGDIDFFNSKIEDFNKWIVDENESILGKDKYEELDKYVSKKYTESVDLNNDGTYLGTKNK